MDVVTAVITAQGERNMTTPTEKQGTAQASATAKKPEATKTAHTAARKPRVTPSKAKSRKKASPAKKITGMGLGSGELHLHTPCLSTPPPDLDSAVSALK